MKNLFSILFIISIGIYGFTISNAKSTTSTVFNKDSMPVYKNIEMVAYCLPLPAKEYRELYKANSVKGKHVFVHKSKKGNSIILQGLIRADTAVSLQQYFEATFPEDEEMAGKVFEEKKIVPATNCMYAKGYWSNFYYKSRFIEIVWLGKDEVVTYTVDYNVADSAVWNKRLKLLLENNAECK